MEARRQHSASVSGAMQRLAGGPFTDATVQGLSASRAAGRRFRSVNVRQRTDLKKLGAQIR